ncbi:MAG: hypothetical protein NXH72_15930 [Hyphomonadaceae bacterium]|nr:hypothetical protein [Hyphomonadaceae bacterium]
MIPCMCIVQDGQISSASEATLKSKLNAFAQKTFGEDADINWIKVPQRSGFTASKPSTSSIVTMRAPEPVNQDDRGPLLHELCQFWIAETGQSMNEIVGVISDPVAA